MKYKNLSKILNAVCGCTSKKNIITYLKAFGSDMSTGFVWLSLESTSVTTRAMLSVRDTAISVQKFPRFLNNAAAQCNWSYQTLCCFCTTNWRTYGRDYPRVWWRHWPESLHRIQTFKHSHILFSLFSHQIPNYKNRYLYCFPFKCVL